MTFSWIPASNDDPCPICRKPNWCSHSPDRQRFKCERLATTQPGFTLTQVRDGGGIFAVGKAGFRHPSPVSRDGKPQPRCDWSTLASRFRSAITPEQRAYLASRLGVRIDALDALGVGWATTADLRELRASGARWADKYPEGAFVFPEEDGTGAVVGLSFRDEDGRKGGPTGGGRGLVIPSNLRDLPDPVLVPEGPSDVAALLSLGIAAVGRPSNATGAAELAVLLRGRDVRIVGENDEKESGAWPGLDGAEAVAEALSDTWQSDVTCVMPAEGSKDVRDWLRAQTDAGLNLTDDEPRFAAGLRLIAGLETTRFVVEPARVKRPLRFRRFPVDALPPALRPFIDSVALSIGVEPSGVALAVLVTCAACVGNTRRARIKNGHDEPPVLWGLMVGHRGAGKSPIFRLVTKALVEIENELFAQHDLALHAWRARREHENRDDSGGDEAIRDPRPTARRLTVKDSTIEALHRVLSQNHAGLLAHVDEFAGFVQAFDAYRTGRGSDRSRWIELYEADPICVDRKSSPDPIRIASGAVWVLSGAQTGMLRRVIGDAENQSGFFARFAVTMPPGEADPLSTASVDPALVEEIKGVYRGLLGLREEEDASSTHELAILPLTDEALAVYHEYVRSNLDDDRSAAPDLEASLIKLRPWAVRCALVLHAIQVVTNGPGVAANTIDADTMSNAVEIAGFFRHEAKRVHQILSGSQEAVQLQSDAEWVRRRGGFIRLRDFQRLRSGGTREVALARLEAIVRAGLGCWDDEAQVGRPGRRGRTLRLLEESSDARPSFDVADDAAAFRRNVETSNEVPRSATSDSPAPDGSAQPDGLDDDVDPDATEMVA